MIIPSKCPRCQDVLLNEIVFNRDNIWQKSCTKKISHKFFIIYDDSTNSIMNYTVQDGSSAFYRFDVKTNKIYLLNLNDFNKSTICNKIELPYFEGNFYKWKDLIHKLRTYTLFA